MATSLGLLRNVCRFYNPHIYIYQCWNVGNDWSSSCLDIWRYRLISVESQHNFHFLPHLNSKTTEPIFTIFIRCTAISVAINAFICKTIVHLILRWPGVECRSFHKFCPKLVAMSTSLEISKKRSRSIIYDKNRPKYIALSATFAERAKKRRRTTINGPVTTRSCGNQCFKINTPEYLKYLQIIWLWEIIKKD